MRAVLRFEISTPERAAARVAAEIAELARERARAGQRCVLGLATGRSPLGVYRELVRLARAHDLPLDTLVAFNLDEYEGLAPGDPRSFAAAMRRELFDPLGWPAQRTHIPRGDLPLAEVERHCADYEAAIRAAGGIDVQLLGIGRNGHIGFNEPGSAPDSRTRRVELAPETRADAAAAFGGLERVPTHALTMGVGTILEARRIRVLAFGASKSAVLRRLASEAPSAQLPASWLSCHPDLRLWSADLTEPGPAASELAGGTAPPGR